MPPAAPVAVWLLDTATLDEARLAGQLGLLCDQERARLSRMRADSARLDFTAGRFLVRTVLSQHAAVAPADWRFRQGPHGRPEIDEPAAHRDLRFNISHTRGLVACAVSQHGAVGIDVEQIDRRVRAWDLARRFFCAEEIAELAALPAGRQQERFFDFWTVKESYLKARGAGLTIPLSRVCVDTAGEVIRLRCPGDVDEQAGAWHLHLSSPTPRHRLALCATVPALTLSWHPGPD